MTIQRGADCAYVDTDSRASRTVLTDAFGNYGGGSLVSESYNQLALTYNGDNTIATVTYKLFGTVVALLTLGYDGSGNLTSVVKT